GAVGEEHLRCPVRQPAVRQDGPPPAKKTRTELVGGVLTPRMQLLLLAGCERGLAALEE
ncbi:unnamed protein product, partial [Prorocentrum cordatum]